MEKFIGIHGMPWYSLTEFWIFCYPYMSDRTNFNLILLNFYKTSSLCNTGVYILENTFPPPPGGGEISADVIWGKKYEKRKRKRGRRVKEKWKGERKMKKGERKWEKRK
jgi:hypothetical protein